MAADRMVMARRFVAATVVAWALLPAPAAAQDPRELPVLLNQVITLFQQNRYAEAAPLMERVAAIQEKMLGIDNPRTQASLGQAAMMWDAAGELGRAQALYERLLAARQKKLGPDHLEVAASLESLAGIHRKKGDYGRAEELVRRVLAIREKALGPDHPDTAKALNSLAGVLEDRGDLAQAEPLYRRGLALVEKKYGPEHAEVAKALNNVAMMLFRKGDYAAAEAMFRRALAINEKVHGRVHHEVGVALNNLAHVYEARGEFARAEEMLRRAIVVLQTVWGPNHVLVSSSYNNLGSLLRNKGDYAGAETYFRRSLDLVEKAFGAAHPLVATSLMNLGEVYLIRGDYRRAEELYLRALAIEEKALGPTHADVGVGLSNLAVLYSNKGDYDRAEALLRRALAISEKVHGPSHPEVATRLSNLAALYHDRKEYKRAEAPARRALAIGEKTLGRTNAHVATFVGNLAAILDAEGKPGAEALFRRAIAMNEKSLGPDNPQTAEPLNNLGLHYIRKRDYRRAEPLLKRAMAIWERAFGPDHPRVALALSNLSGLAEARGDTAAAIRFAARNQEIRERNLALTLATGSEEQKQAYMKTVSSEAEGVVSLHVRSAPGDQDAARLALLTVLRRKGRVLDAVADSMSALRQRLKPEDRALLDQLASVRSQLAAQVLRPTGTLPPERRREIVAGLQTEAQRLEAAVSARSAEFRVREQPVSIERVRVALPPGGVLVEIAAYRPLDVKARVEGKQWGAPRYVAYVLRREGDVTWADLGDAATIDAEVEKLRRTLAAPESADFRALARAVDERVLRPLRPLLAGAQLVLLSPDRALNLVPFAALLDERGHYAVESAAMTYLTSGRDLLRLAVATPSHQGPVVFADPMFDEEQPAPDATGAPPQVAAVDGRRSADLRTLRFAPLPGTADEAAALKGLLPGVAVLEGAAATEEALKRLHSPSVLHLATHGFFLPDQPGSVAARDENPLLRSGLALAGANRRHEGVKDGLLTALEVASLDLLGTRLVVLSACETGVGRASTGEGVYGLRRALVIAGAASQVMSLWKVSDQATRDLMTAYYRALRAGRGRVEALRAVQLELLGRKGREHPYYWASFIPIGDWRSVPWPAVGAGRP